VELFDVTQRALEVALHGSELRQTVIANNIANVNTPGFKRSDVSFGPDLAGALAAGDAGDVAEVDPTVTLEGGTTMRVDGNNVDIDREANNLAQTQLHFSALMAVVTKNLSTMSQIITSAR
jgi:flagellar basal-body rod protein FlgB